MGAEYMRIAFLHRLDAYSRRSWSGIFFFMLQAMERHCGDVEVLGPAGQGWLFAGKVIGRFAKVCLRNNIDYSHTVALSRIMGNTFSRKLSRDKVDVIFAPVASTEIAFLDTALPIVYFGDLTAKLFRNYAARFMGLSSWAIAQTETIESRALQRADHLVYASQWAACSAIEDYRVPENKVSVIPMGANLDKVPSAAEVSARRRRTPSNECRLLFVGVDWERKGGGTVLSAMHKLRERGIDATLTVVGCTPPGAGTEPYMRIVPFLDKTIPEHQRQLTQLLLEADFMLFPTRREAFGVVCCEANACGLPLIVSDEGGIPVRNGENGIMLPPAASGSDYADVVHSLLKDPARYLQLAQGGRRAFESYLNWDSWARSMAEVFRRALRK